MGCWMTSICVLHRVEVDEEVVRWCALWKVQWWRKLSMSVNDKDLLSWNITTLEGLLYMEGMLPGISSFQPRDMSFSGVNADTFSASIFTETFSLPSSKTEEMHIGHPCALCPLYTLHLWCYNITTVTWSKHHLASSSSSQISTTFISMVLSCSQHFSPAIFTLSHHFLLSSHSFASRPSKLQSCGSLTGAQQRPWGLESNGTRHNTSQLVSKRWWMASRFFAVKLKLLFHVPLAKWRLWSKWFYHCRKLTLPVASTRLIQKSCGLPDILPWQHATPRFAFPFPSSISGTSEESTRDLCQANLWKAPKSTQWAHNDIDTSITNNSSTKITKTNTHFLL